MGPRARRELTAAWAGCLSFVTALLGLQPGWQTDVVATVVFGLAAAATGVRFALTPRGHRWVDVACGDGLAGAAIHYLLGLVHRWRQAGAAHPAWH